MRKRTPGLAVYGLADPLRPRQTGVLASGGLHVLVP
jgi:hypothetical protein